MLSSTILAELEEVVVAQEIKSIPGKCLKTYPVCFRSISPDKTRTDQTLCRCCLLCRYSTQCQCLTNHALGHVTRRYHQCVCSSHRPTRCRTHPGVPHLQIHPTGQAGFCFCSTNERPRIATARKCRFHPPTFQQPWREPHRLCRLRWQGW